MPNHRSRKMGQRGVRGVFACDRRGRNSAGSRWAGSRAESRGMKASPPERTETRAPRWATLTATLFGTGYLRPGPGTWGSAITVVLWGALAHSIPAKQRIPLLIALAVLVIIIGIAAATQVCRASGKKDPQFVVIDEVAGQLIALIAVPLAWQTFLTGFILFRAFDIIKPPPARQLERLAEGTGIVLDDVAAGIYALLVMQILLRFFHLLKYA